MMFSGKGCQAGTTAVAMPRVGPPPSLRTTDITFMGGSTNSSSSSSSNSKREDAGKLRIRESYVRLLLDNNNNHSMSQQQQQTQQHQQPPGNSHEYASQQLYIIPDAQAWRTYLPWITRLSTLLSTQESLSPSSSSPLRHATATATTTTRVQIVLLESVVQDLEWRNQAIPEVAAPQERTKLMRLVRRDSSSARDAMTNNNTNVAVIPFCDLSVRDADFDEYEDIMTHHSTAANSASSLKNNPRPRLLAVRAARLLRQQSANPSHCEVLLWCHDEEEDGQDHAIIQEDAEASSTAAVRHFRPTVDDDDEEEGVHFVDPQSLMQILRQQQALFQREENFEKVQDELDRLSVRCLQEYIHRQEQHQQQLLQGRRKTSKSQDDSSTSPTIWTEFNIPDGLQSGRLGRGRYQVSKENPAEAFCSWKGAMWFLASKDEAPVVHAIDQDFVIIEPLPSSKWEQPLGRRRLVAAANNTKSDEDDDDDIGDDDDDIGESNNNTEAGTVATEKTSRALSSSTNTVPTARLVKVDQIGTRRVVVATLTEAPTLGDEAAVLLTPMDIRIPRIRVHTKEWQKWLGRRVLVQIDAWEADSKYPAGHVQTILGAVGDLETEISCLLHEHRIPMDAWSLASRACLPRPDWTIPQSEVVQRRDLRRTHNIFSVDPAGCQDIDDCMHARRLPNGDIEVGVHIADVTHFVPLDSALDLQARRRGTTFYLVDRRYDMLPAVLSSNLCSLHGGADRLAVSVIWTLTEDMGQILSTWYGRTVIHNVAAMTYEQADRILKGDTPEAAGETSPPPLTAGAPVNRALVPKLREDLEILTRLARQRRRDRQDFGGAVDLSSADTGSELKFTLVNGEPVQVRPKQTKEIHRTIEEMMIWANTSVASKIKQSYPKAALLRIHRAVDEERFDDLKGLLAAGDISFKGKTNAELAESLQIAQQRSEKNVASLFRSLATRAMSEALYVSTGSIESADRLAHYGLGLKEYTHFTSPIRRYADVVVHHQLLSALTHTEYHVAMPEVPRAPVLSNLPASTVRSILTDTDAMVEVTNDELDLEIDELIGGLGDKASMEEARCPPSSHTERRARRKNGAFLGEEVARICEHLNEHNRLAKHSSSDCQGLFLSLYFRNHMEYAQAVVTDLRENGFYCYIPKFDMKGPVYIRDMEGHVQIDPAFFELPRMSGSEPTSGFASSNFIRRFSPLESEIWFKENQCLEIFVRCRSFALHPLDVVTVAISCPDWDNRARVPSPRIQLVYKKYENTTTTVPAVTSEQTVGPRRTKSTSSKGTTSSSLGSDEKSLFDLFEQLQSKELPGDSKVRLSETTAASLTSKTVVGRLSWGGFVNPDTRAAAQAAALEAAAALRGERPASSSNEYDMNNRVAREVTLRQQRLAAEKRNARRSKRS